MTPGNIKGALLALLSMGLYSTHDVIIKLLGETYPCLLYTSPSPRDRTRSRMPSSA